MTLQLVSSSIEDRNDRCRDRGQELPATQCASCIFVFPGPVGSASRHRSRCPTRPCPAHASACTRSPPPSQPRRAAARSEPASRNCSHPPRPSAPDRTRRPRPDQHPPHQHPTDHTPTATRRLSARASATLAADETTPPHGSRLTFAARAAQVPSSSLRRERRRPPRGQSGFAPHGPGWPRGRPYPRPARGDESATCRDRNSGPTVAFRVALCSAARTRLRRTLVADRAARASTRNNSIRRARGCDTRGPVSTPVPSIAKERIT